MSKSLFILIGYFMLTTAVILATVGLVAYGQGYSYDLRTNRLTHNGLVLIDSVPSGATVRADTKFGTKKTPYHVSFEQGSYRFSISKTGYLPWTRVMNVIASQVTLAQYVILIPQKRVETTLDHHAQMTAQVISRDHRHMAYIVPGVSGGLYTIDLTNGRPATKLYTTPVAADAVQQETLTTVAWSDDNSHLLLNASVAGAPVVRLITASDGTAVNLTDKFHFDFSTLRFSTRDWRQLYWLSPDGIRRLDAGAQTVTGILADKVSQFEIAGDRVLYVQSTDLGESLGALDARDRRSTVIQALVKSPTYAIKYASYRGQDIIAVVPSSNGTGTIYTDAYSPDVTAKAVAQNVTSVLYSADSHLVTFYSPTQLVTYDMEQSNILNRSVSYSVTYPFTQKIDGISYYDGFHILINQGGHLVFAEYDGQNANDLGSIAAGSVPYQLADQRAIVMVTAGTTDVLLRSISIK